MGVRSQLNAEAKCKHRLSISQSEDKDDGLWRAQNQPL
jgi:hypothetical protein